MRLNSKSRKRKNRKRGSFTSPIGFITSLLSLKVELPELVRLYNSVSQFHCLNLIFAVGMVLVKEGKVVKENEFI